MPVCPRNVFYFPSTTYWKTNRGVPRSATWGRALEGRESVEDGKCSGLPQTSRTADNIEKVSAVIRKNGLQPISESVEISSATYQWVLNKDPNMLRLCQHIIPCMLNDDQSADEVKKCVTD
ncbi:hypothetical protein TNCV_993171 [Trichonephila clavipes]|nr:hypothetical protein TNCV_993171 [Trichonephila clavipes]